VIVHSVAGVQSSGKSTLLNTLYGTSMETSVGACTRGINIALIPSEGKWKAKCDFILVMDTEGICNPNFMGEKWYDFHNNWTAYLVLMYVVSYQTMRMILLPGQYYPLLCSAI